MMYKCRQCNSVAKEASNCPTCNIPMNKDLLGQDEQPGVAPVAPTPGDQPAAPVDPVAPEMPLAPEMPAPAPEAEPMPAPEMPAPEAEPMPAPEAPADPEMPAEPVA